MLAESRQELQHQLKHMKAMIIEDSFESRGLLKSQLMHFGIREIVSLENGSKLLREQQPLDVDVLIIGFGLGYCHSGIELVQTLTSLKMLPVWCKVIFITNSDLLTSNSNPFRYLKCEVLRKPINPRMLKQLIEEGAGSIHYYRDIVEDLTNNQLQGLLIKLEGTPRGKLTETQNDELSAITMHLLLRLGEGNKAWKLVNSITDEVFRSTNRLAIANALGDERKLKMTIGMLQASTAMRKRAMIYQVYLLLREEKYLEAMDLIKGQGTHTFSLAEIELYALLMVESVGLNKAIEFLTFKRGTSLENTFFRNSIRLIKIKCYVYTLLKDIEAIDEHEAQLAKLNELLFSTDWKKGTVDFSPVIVYARHLIDVICQNNADEHEADFRVLGNKVTDVDLLPLLFMTASAHFLGQNEKAKELLLKADEAMQSLEVSPESLVNQLWFSKVFDTLFAESEQAREFNRIGIHHAQHDNPYQALNMFYHSHLCAKENASIAINLLDTLTKLGLDVYWETSQSALTQKITQLKLRENEQRKFNEIINRAR